MRRLKKLFIKGKVETKKEEQKYPVGELEKNVGEFIEIHYINCGKSKAPERALLKTNPTQHSFHIGDLTGSHIIYWNHTDSYGLHAVRLLKGPDGQIIYDNDKVPYDYKPKRENDSFKSS